jgi:hypothetical protein
MGVVGVSQGGMMTPLLPQPMAWLGAVTGTLTAGVAPEVTPAVGVREAETVVVELHCSPGGGA